MNLALPSVLSQKRWKKVDSFSSLLSRHVPSYKEKTSFSLTCPLDDEFLNSRTWYLGKLDTLRFVYLNLFINQQLKQVMTQLSLFNSLISFVW